MNRISSCEPIFKDIREKVIIHVKVIRDKQFCAILRGNNFHTVFDQMKKKTNKIKPVKNLFLIL